MVNLIFSPTGTGRRILNSITEGFNAQTTRDIDITKDPVDLVLGGNDILFIVFPVYAGRIPVLVEDRIASLKGEGVRAVVIGVYGNRHYDDALLEMSNILEAKGFNTVSAAAFIGEHSFSVTDYPLAEGRPDSADLDKAFDYGNHLKDKLNGGSVTKPEIPGNFPYKEIIKRDPIAPVTDPKLCDNCLECADICPTCAITKDNHKETIKELCIKCTACVKSCKTGARFWDDQWITDVRKILIENCIERREPEIFL